MVNSNLYSKTNPPPSGTETFSIQDWLDYPLYNFQPDVPDGKKRDEWTVRDAVEGTQIFGATGSGKSSGSGRALATGLIRAGIGGVVLAAKDDELEQWLSYFADAGIDDPIGDDRLRVIEPGGDHWFDPLAHEFGLAPEGGTRRLTKLFMTALGSGEGRVSSDPYWDDALRHLLGHAIDLVSYGSATVDDEGCLKMRQEAPSLAEIAEVVKTSAISADEARSSRWLDSEQKCPALLRSLDENHRKLDAKKYWAIEADMRDTFGYWSREFPSLADRTRSVIITSFTGKANDLLRRPLRELFCSGDSEVEVVVDGEKQKVKSVAPEATHEGVIVLVNIPVKDYGEVGEFAQKLYKTVWQHATESSSRDPKKDGTQPVFLWADEAQHFVTREDVLFQATARSKLSATIFLTQNISNYYTVLGGDKSSATDALLGSLQMKIMHANGDAPTNEWAERTLGSIESTKATRGGNFGVAGEGAGTLGKSFGEHTRVVPLMPAQVYTVLTRGGGKPAISQGVVFHAGKHWPSTKQVDSDGKPTGVGGPFIVHEFAQNAGVAPRKSPGNLF